MRCAQRFLPDGQDAMVIIGDDGIMDEYDAYTFNAEVTPKSGKCVVSPPSISGDDIENAPLIVQVAHHSGCWSLWKASMLDELNGQMKRGFSPDGWT